MASTVGAVQRLLPASSVFSVASALSSFHSFFFASLSPYFSSALDSLIHLINDPDRSSSWHSHLCPIARFWRDESWLCSLIGHQFECPNSRPTLSPPPPSTTPNTTSASTTATASTSPLKSPN